MTHTAQPPVGRLYEVGGRSLFLHRKGSGGPAVVFLPGGATVGLMYLNVFERVGEVTTAVLYDRGATGWSDLVDLPRSATDAAVELRDLLGAAGVPGPYVLVAHSLGGLHARRFTQLFPELVAGVVGLEPLYERWDDHVHPTFGLAVADELNQSVPVELPPEVLGYLRALGEEKFAAWPPGVREPLIAKLLDAGAIAAAMRERGNIADQAAEVRAAGDVPDRPLITFTALGDDPSMAMVMPDEELREHGRAKRMVFDALVGSVKDAEHRLLADATHSWLHIEAEDAVVAGVHDMLAKVR
jgi:pimeloyl-ACP methyl ester carboxylesterase